MNKETTYRVRAIGISGAGEAWAEKTFENPAYQEMDVVNFHLREWCSVRDYELARLETLVSGPLEVRRDRSGAVRYLRTVIDTKEEVLRPWADPGCLARWLRLSEDANEETSDEAD